MNLRIPGYSEEFGSYLVHREGATLEEKEAISMASNIALRRDLAPIVAVRIVRDDGAITLQVIQQGIVFDV